MFQPDRLADLIQEDRCAGPRRYAPDSLDDLIAWLETQPADRSYVWYDVGACLMCTYREEACSIPRNFLGNTAGGKHGYRAPFGEFRNQKDGYGEVAAKSPWTMGAALVRARAWKAAQ